MSSVEFTDNSDEVKAAMRSAILRGLEKCGLAAEKYAKKLCPVDTGNLRNSISHTVDTEEPAAYIGTNSEYAPYVEFGTGIYATGGRPTPWAYQDAKGTNKKWERHHRRPTSCILGDYGGNLLFPNHAARKSATGTLQTKNLANAMFARLLWWR